MRRLANESWNGAPHLLLTSECIAPPEKRASAGEVLRIESAAIGDARALLESALRECGNEQRFFCGADLEEAVNRTYRRCCRKAMPNGWPRDRETLTIVLTADELDRSLREVRKSIDEQSLTAFLIDVDQFCGSTVAREMRANLKAE